MTPPDDVTFRLGTVEASEAVIRDLYIKLRDDLRRWARLTRQTSQPRMGYLGQHLTSVVTGYPGGRSGARGYDLVLPEARHAEIKTCYRVDQVGSCKACGELVSANELECAACGSAAINRKNDSKWLLSPKHDEEFAAFFDPAYYYFVLFDFEDFANPTVINASIWEVDPRADGFRLALIDYYENIRTQSESKAPFNLWPYDLKFQLMAPKLIYRASIDPDDSIRTQIFPGERGSPVVMPVAPLTSLGRGKVLTEPVVDALAESLGLAFPDGSTKSEKLSFLEGSRRDGAWDEERLRQAIVTAYYGPRVAPHDRWLTPRA